MCVSLATGLSMNTDSLDETADIHLVLNETELSKIININFDIINDTFYVRSIYDYFYQHPNQTQAVSYRV